MHADRRSAALPFVAVGVTCVVAGGLVAAATASIPSQLASWTTAYLVLVAGVSQVALGAGQALLTPRTPSRRLIAVEFAAWNGGNAAVVAGTLLGLVPMVDAGGVLLVVALALLARGTRGDSRRGSGNRGRWPLYAFRALVVILLVSVPIGLVLGRITPS
ncbi:MAG: hypothetical protein ACRDVZ_09775 [Jiangellaceae bacterium]